MTSANKSAQLCDVNDSCFVIIDIQENLTPALPVNVIKRLRNNTLVLLNAANQLNIPVIATAQYPKGLGPIEEAITSKLSDSAKYFEKTSFSCLGADGFSAHLTTLNKKQVILVGIEAHICVLQTAFELIADGFDVFVVSDATGSRKLTNYDSAIMRLNQAGIYTTNTESVLFEWLRDASNPDFKTLSRLIV